MRKTPFLAGLCFGLGQKWSKSTLFGRGLIKKRAKIVNKTLCGNAMARFRAKTERNIPFG